MQCSVQICVFDENRNVSTDEKKKERTEILRVSMPQDENDAEIFVSKPLGIDEKNLLREKKFGWTVPLTR